MAYRRTSTRTANTGRNSYQEVTDRFVQAIEKALADGSPIAPWQHPWTSGGRPRSMSTGKAYRGINSLLLGLAVQANGWTSPWFGTYKQVASLGGQVRRGEKSSLAVLYKTFDKTEHDDETGEDVTKTIPMLRVFAIFNADQCDNLPERYYAKAGAEVELAEPQAVLDGYLASEGAPDFFQDVEGQAFFVPATNEVHVPPMRGHKSPDHYWRTVWHEVGHAADFKIRRNAEEAEHGRSQATYSFGELVAEMCSGILAAETGVQVDEQNSVSYLRGWLSRLQDDNHLVVRAAAAAQRCADLILANAEVTEEVAA